MLDFAKKDKFFLNFRHVLLHLALSLVSHLNKYKAGLTAIRVPCGWAGAVSFGQDSDAKNFNADNVSATEGPSDELTKQNRIESLSA